MQAMDVTAQELFDVIIAASERAHWDSLCQECATIEALDVGADEEDAQHGEVAADICRLVVALQERQIDFSLMRCATVCTPVACICYLRVRGL